MTQEEQFEPSVRAPGNPLIHFKGVLKEYHPVDAGGGGRKYTVIEFNFTDVEVIESREPYYFPITSFGIGYSAPSDRGRPGQGNRWEVLSASLRKLLGPENAELKVLKGKMQEWEQRPGTIRQALKDEDGNQVMMENPDGSPVIGNNGQPREEWGDVVLPCWQLVALEGVGSAEEVDTEFMGHLCGLADGKDDRAFYEAAFGDSKVTGKPDVVQSITDRLLVQTLLDAGRLERSTDGMLHKVDK